MCPAISWPGQKAHGVGINMFFGLVKLIFWLVTLPLRFALRVSKFMMFLMLPLLAIRLFKSMMAGDWPPRP